MIDNNQQNEEVKGFSIENLLTEDKYLIPIYQRNYAWGHDEITQLIQDVWDFAKNKNGSNYYIGTLVTHQRQDKKYEVLDGQQRLTTLYILVAALKSLGKGIENIKAENLNLHFEAREESTETLNNLLEAKIEGEMQSILNGFEIAKNYLENKENKICLQKFTNYLLNNVILVRTIVPPDTDLNHYFEIMNNRGEQLEKHEILKAELLSAICESERTQYAKVWEACSQMDIYVQMNFDKISSIKKTGDNKKDKNNDVSENTTEEYEKEKNKNTIECILERKEDILKNNTDSSTSNESERFESIIDFPNFLLQVLKVTEETDDKKISLDDKKLLDKENGFYKFKENNNFTKDFAQEFIPNLLKYRFWFDKFIIKRKTASDEENWSLKSWVNNGDEENKGINKEITMIQSMFHVSNPNKSNKRWLAEVFKKCYCKENLKENKNADCFLNKLEEISKKLLGDNLKELIKKYNEKENFFKDNLKFKTFPNYLFNLLDYVIWKFKNNPEKFSKLEDEFKKSLKEQLDKINNNFSFKFRNSVEHFHPQSKVDSLKINTENGEKDTREDKEKYLHSFGNLALTTRGENSKFSKFEPQNKIKEIADVKTQSLKFQLMAQNLNGGDWDSKKIQNHQEAMIELLQKY